MTLFIRDLKKKCAAMQMKCFQGSTANASIDILMTKCSLYEFLAQMQQLGVEAIFYSPAFFEEYFIPDTHISPLKDEVKKNRCQVYNAYLRTLNQHVLGRCLAIYGGKMLCWQQFNEPNSVRVYGEQRTELHLPGLATIFQEISNDASGFDYGAAARELEENQ